MKNITLSADENLTEAALDIQLRYQYDSLIVVAALESGCNLIQRRPAAYQRIEQLTINNPFME